VAVGFPLALLIEPDVDMGEFFFEYPPDSTAEERVALTEQKVAEFEAAKKAARTDHAEAYWLAGLVKVACSAGGAYLGAHFSTQDPKLRREAAAFAAVFGGLSAAATMGVSAAQGFPENVKFGMVAAGLGAAWAVHRHDDDEPARVQ
jgi:hypothetical protein